MPKLKTKPGSGKKKAAPAGGSGLSIVLRTEQGPVADLNPYYKNARRGDVEKVAESLHENGQFKPIVVNIGTKTGRENEILAGNHTYLAARRLGWETMLVSWVDLDEDQARQVVLADNAAGDHSTYDEALLTELLQEQQESTGSLLGTAFDNDVLGKLVKKMGEDENANVDMIEEASDYLGGVDDMADNIVFPSDLPYEMPPLLENMCLDELPVTPDKLDVWAGHELDLPRQEAEPDRWWLTQWHAGCRGVNWKQSIPYFYCPDAHFESLFLHPAQQTKKILNLGCKAVIMPNYSIDEVAPSATWVWAMYRNLYMARYFQEAGIKVIPDIRVGTTGSDVLELYAPSYPKGVGVVACQIQNANKDPEYIRATARVLREAEERIEFQSIIVYGHNDADDAVKRAGLSCEVIRVQNRSARRREYLNSGSTINTQKVSKSRKKS